MLGKKVEKGESVLWECMKSEGVSNAARDNKIYIKKQSDNNFGNYY